MMGTVRGIILSLMLQCLVILTGAKTVALFFLTPVIFLVIC